MRSLLATKLKPQRSGGTAAMSVGTKKEFAAPEVAVTTQLPLVILIFWK
jgi:hypothetical protein